MESRRRIGETLLTWKTERFMSKGSNLIYGLTSFRTRSTRTRYRPLRVWERVNNASELISFSLPFGSERWGNELPEVLIACVSRRIDSYPIYHVQISWIFLLFIRSICWIEGRRSLERLLRWRLSSSCEGASHVERVIDVSYFFFFFSLSPSDSILVNIHFENKERCDVHICDRFISLVFVFVFYVLALKRIRKQKVIM